jgi:hypothetical protein
MPHTNVTPLTAAQRATYAVKLLALANPAAQVGTQDPESAAAAVAWIAAQYAKA